MKDLIQRIEQLCSTARRLFLQTRMAVLLMGMVGFLILVALLDFVFRLPDMFRMALLTTGLVMLGFVIIRSIVPALRFRPSLIQMALRVEDQNPSIRGRLASGVEFALHSESVDGTPLGPLAQRTVDDVEKRASAISFKGLLDARLANQMLAGLLLLLAMVAIFVIWRPTESAIAAKRVLLPFGSAKWPARTLVESGMDPRLVHPRGEPLVFAARLSKGDPGRDAVSIRYRYERKGAIGDWQELRMTRQSGNQFERVVDTDADGIEYLFFTDEDQTDLRAVRIIPAPAVLSTKATITPPSYAADRGPLTSNLGTGTDRRSRFEGVILEGSQADIEIELNRPLPIPEEDADSFISKVITVPGEESIFDFKLDPESPDRWLISFQLDQGGDMTMSLRDENGLENLDPIRYRFDTIEDRSPTVTISRPVADESVSSRARVTVVVEARDDVALADVQLETTLRQNGADSRIDLRDDLDHGEAFEETIKTSTTASLDLDLSEMELVGGDEVVLVAVAADTFEMNGVRHKPVRSTPRRLVVVSDAEVAEQLRSNLANIRRSAIRMEGEQADLQDGIRSRGADEGIRRNQARLGDRLATAAESLEAISDRREQNQLDMPMLEEVLRQSQDIIEAARRASAEAVDAIERTVSENRSSAQNQSGSESSAGSELSASSESSSSSESSPGSELSSSSESSPGSESSASPESSAGSESSSSSESPTGSESSSSSESSAGSESSSSSESSPGSESQPGSRSASNENESDVLTDSEQEAIEAQDTVRAELTDLASLLDRDEDAWVVTRRVQQMQERLQEMIERTEELGEETIGRERSELSDAEREAIDRLAAEQANEQEEAQELIEELQQRAEALERADPTQAAGLRQAAQRAREGQLAQQMEEASEASRNNRLQQAEEAQQQAAETLEEMMGSIEESRKARVEDIRRRISSLVESIESLVAASEDELIALAQMVDDPDVESISARAREMMRLNTNTLSVAAEARAAGNEGSRIARSVDRAARSQGAAIGNLRSNPADLDEARDDEERALVSLKEALEAAREQAERMAEQQAEEQRRELLSFYTELLDRQSLVKVETEAIFPEKGQRLGRRGLVTSRRMAIEQNQIGERLTNLKEDFQEITDSLVFSLTHRNLDAWSEEISTRLQQGEVDVDTIEYQTMMLDALGGLMQALAQEQDQEDPFEQPENQQAGGQGQGQEGGQPQPLIPPIAELKALKSLQQQILDATVRMDTRRSDLDPDVLSRRLEELGEMQSDLHAVGTALIQQLQPSGESEPVEPESSNPSK